MHASSEMADLQRRSLLKTAGGLGLVGLFATLGLFPASASAEELKRTVFDAKNLDEALDALGGFLAEQSSLVGLTAPDVAENGALVPVTIETSLAGVSQISILVDKNPTMLVANFTIPSGTPAFLTTRIRMAQTSSVIVLVKAGGKFYRAGKEVKVNQGGC